MTDNVPLDPDLDTSDPLSPFFDAKTAIARCESLDEIKEIRNRAEAARKYVQAAGLSTGMANRCAVIRLRAERRAGEILQATTLHQGGRPTENRLHDETGFKLVDFDVSKIQSHRWQKIADIPEEYFEGYCAAAEDEDNSDWTTAVGLAQYVARQRDPGDVPDPIPPKPSNYRAIVIDPPWPMKKIERDVHPNQGVALDYPTLTLEEIADETIVPVRTHADDDCHIYLWVTHKFLPAGLELLGAWGFRYQCLMTWRKNVGFTPFSWMYDTEHVLFGTRGNLPLLQNGLRLSFEAPRTGHSVKPDIFYERVTAASPGPRIDMFARTEREGFDVWGNEVNDAVI